MKKALMLIVLIGMFTNSYAANLSLDQIRTDLTALGTRYYDHDVERSSCNEDFECWKVTIKYRLEVSDSNPCIVSIKKDSNIEKRINFSRVDSVSVNSSNNKTLDFDIYQATDASVRFKNLPTHGNSPANIAEYLKDKVARSCSSLFPVEENYHDL
jgi:hypothetical protein